MRYACSDSFLLEWQISYYIPGLGKLSSIHVVLSSFGLTLFKLVFGHVNDGF